MKHTLLCLFARLGGASLLFFLPCAGAAQTALVVTAETPASLYPLSQVRLLPGSPFAAAVEADRAYILALDPDRLLAPFRREAGLPKKAESYGNWESGGLDGHTAGHYLSALSHLIASGADTPDRELSRRLSYMVSEMAECQKAFGDGYVGGVPGSRELWKAVASGDVGAIDAKWVPWYNLHKTFAGLRDAWVEAGSVQAREVLVRLGDWCVAEISGLSDEEMQRMLGMEHGGMNEALADVYAITGDKKFLAAAEKFRHRAILDPLVAHRDELTGRHANTQIPKVVGLEKIALLTGNSADASGAEFFWNDVVEKRSVAFGGNSVSEHFNDPKDFYGVLVHREGPETCNTYNMLKLTEELFTGTPQAKYADYYERALYNHILSAIDTCHPGFVYFTPIRPEHYRVYSVPENSFWCCVGTGMENPGKYGEFLYARAKNAVYVNLFVASVLKAPELGLELRQETKFPDEEASSLILSLENPATFSLYVRNPAWVEKGAFALSVNGEAFAQDSAPGSYVEIRRRWKDGDRVQVALPMKTTVEGLPDGSDWYAVFHGPILLGAESGGQDQDGLFAEDTRMAHVAAGPLVPLGEAPALLAKPEEIPAHVAPDPAAGPMHFRLSGIVTGAKDGIELKPFYEIREERYQIYWEATTPEKIAAEKEKRAAAERAQAAREKATVDFVSPGEQQSEVEHSLRAEGTDSGLHNARHWRHGRMIEYTLDPRGEKNVRLSVTYSGDDDGRTFDIFANGILVATQTLTAEKRGEFVEKDYELPSTVFKDAPEGRIVVRFVGKGGLAGGVYDVRLLRADAAR